MIKIENLTKEFGDNKVLSGINQEVVEGSVIVLIGASGSGKSTFLRCLNRTEIPTSGRITLDDKELDYKNVNSGQTISGMVFQDFNLFPHLTVLENLTIAPTKAKGVKPAVAKQTALSLLEKFGLSDKASAYPRHLSGGQQQRVAIARELAMNPKIILFDEPTSALDPEKVVELEDIVRELKTTGITMFIVTHNMDFASKIADKIWLMKDGDIAVTGSPEAMLEKAKTDPDLRPYFAELI